MSRQTSIDVYHRIESEGLLSKRRFEVYALLYNHGPLTAAQVMKKYQTIYKPVLHSGSIATRLSELRNSGSAYEVKQDICPLTGNNVIFWDVTNKLPNKIVKKIRQKCSHCKGTGYAE